MGGGGNCGGGGAKLAGGNRQRVNWQGVDSQGMGGGKLAGN